MNTKSRIIKILIVTLVMITVMQQPNFVSARTLAWGIIDCSKDRARGCTEDVRKIASVSAPNVNGYLVSIRSTLPTGVKVVVSQTNQTNGDLRVTFVVNNVGTFGFKYERRQKDNTWSEEVGRPSDYQKSWVEEQIAGLQKQDKDFDFTDAR